LLGLEFSDSLYFISKYFPFRTIKSFSFFGTEPNKYLFSSVLEVIFKNIILFLKIYF